MTKDNESIYGRVLGICFHFLLNVVFVFMIVEGYNYSYHFAYNLFADVPAAATSTTVKEVVIEEGSTAKDVAQELELVGIIQDKHIFVARAYVGKYRNKIKAGTYSLGPGMSPDQICRIICGMQSEETP